MTVTPTQHILGPDGATLPHAASFSQAFNTPVSASGFVVGAVYQHDSNGSSSFRTTNITDDHSNVYTIVDDSSPSGFTGWFTIFIGGPFSNGPTTITASGSGGSGTANRWRMTLIEFPQINTSPLDGHTVQGQVTPGNGTDGITSGTISPAVSGDVVVSFTIAGGTNPATLTQGTGFTLLDSAVVATDAVAMASEYVNYTSGMVAGTWTQTGSGTQYNTAVLALSLSSATTTVFSDAISSSEPSLAARSANERRRMMWSM